MVSFCDIFVGNRINVLMIYFSRVTDTEDITLSKITLRIRKYSMNEYVKFIPIWLYLRHPSSLCSEPLWKLQCPNDLVHILICLC